MAVGDKAAAAGLAVFAATDDRRDGWQNDNVRGDELAEHMTTGGHDWSRITGKPNVSVVGHTHDDRYYTKAIIDAAFSSQNSIDATQNARLDALEAAPSSAADTVTPAAYGRSVTGGGYFAMWMGANLQIGRNTSSRRYKEAIEPHAVDPAAVLALEPVSYHRIGSPEEQHEYGLIAEDVAEHLPEIVVEYGGQIDGVRYDLLAVALLGVVKTQARRLDDLAARLDALEG